MAGKRGRVPINYFSFTSNSDLSDEISEKQEGKDKETIEQEGEVEDDPQDEEYFENYGFNMQIHLEMLQDESRTSTYQSAIASLSHLPHSNNILDDKTIINTSEDVSELSDNSLATMKNKVVMDVGCGTGILSIFCAREGQAAKVIGVDASELTSITSQIVERNGFGDKISIVQCDMEEFVFDPNERIDVIVSEWMGTLLLFESMISAVIYARDEVFKINSTLSDVEGVDNMPILLPSSASIFLHPVNMQERWDERIDYWDDVYGLDMGPVKERVTSHYYARPNITDIIKASSLIGSSPSECVWDCDMRLVSNQDTAFIHHEWIIQMVDDNKKDEEEEMKSVVTTSSSSGGGERSIQICHGFVGWFDTLFPSSSPQDQSNTPPPIILSTSPLSPPTHWKQTLLLFDTPLEINPSLHDRMSVGFKMVKNEDYPRHYRVEVGCCLMKIGETKQQCEDRIKIETSSNVESGEKEEDIIREKFVRHKIWPLWR